MPRLALSGPCECDLSDVSPGEPERELEREFPLRPLRFFSAADAAARQMSSARCAVRVPSKCSVAMLWS